MGGILLHGSRGARTPRLSCIRYLVGLPIFRADVDLQRSQQSCQDPFLRRNEGDVIQDYGTPFAANMEDKASGVKKEILKDIGDLLVDPHPGARKSDPYHPKAPGGVVVGSAELPSGRIGPRQLLPA